MILGAADGDEQNYVFDYFTTNFRRGGINGNDGYKGPTL
jgi:hypothetical protein